MATGQRRGILVLRILGILIFLSSAYLVSQSQDNRKTEGPSVRIEKTPGIASPIPTSSLVSRQSAKVIRIIDGDTVNVFVDNKSRSVRLIGIDAPESGDPRKPVQCFAKEATARLKELLSDKTVFLEPDPAQANTDKYYRLLRYIFLEDGVNINKVMIAEGYAHEYTYNLPYVYQDDFKQAEIEARENKRGLWADKVCD